MQTDRHRQASNGRPTLIAQYTERTDRKSHGVGPTTTRPERLCPMPKAKEYHGGLPKDAPARSRKAFSSVQRRPSRCHFLSRTCTPSPKRVESLSADAFTGDMRGAYTVRGRHTQMALRGCWLRSSTGAVLGGFSNGHSSSKKDRPWAEIPGPAQSNRQTQSHKDARRQLRVERHPLAAPSRRLLRQNRAFYRLRLRAKRRG